MEEFTASVVPSDLIKEYLSSSNAKNVSLVPAVGVVEESSCPLVILTVSSTQIFREYFKNSLVIELYWENKIDYIFKNENNLKPKSISILNLFKKFISKKLRSLFR